MAPYFKKERKNKEYPRVSLAVGHSVQSVPVGVSARRGHYGYIHFRRFIYLFIFFVRGGKDIISPYAHCEMERE